MDLSIYTYRHNLSICTYTCTCTCTCTYTPSGTTVAVKCVIPRRGDTDEESSMWQDPAFSNAGANSRSNGSLLGTAIPTGSVQSKCNSPLWTLRGGSLSQNTTPTGVVQPELPLGPGPVTSQSQRGSAAQPSRVSSQTSNATAASQVRPLGLRCARELPPTPSAMDTPLGAVRSGLSYSQLMSAHSNSQARGPNTIIWRHYGPEGGVPAPRKERNSSASGSRPTTRAASSESKVS
jgi:hypothetical protein